MGNSKAREMLENLDSKLSISRRSFVKGSVAVGAAAALYGCSKDGGGDVIYGGGGDGGTVELPDTAPMERFYGSSGHNCGGRCVTIAEVSKGKIQRFLTDESKYTSDGTRIDPESRNFPQTRSCARCRSYKYRLYHPGRLLYPLKQTKKRGDLSGFKRITWEQALTEIATKHKKVIDEYGVDGIYQMYACGSVSSQFNGAQSGPIGKSNGYAIMLMDKVTTNMFGSYSTHQHTYFGLNYTGMDGSTSGHVNEIAKHTKNLVLWGDNSMSTGNNSTYGSIRAVEDMKKRDGEGVYFIGPEFVDGGVTLADEWIVSKPYTDPALVAGMIYHMLDNTFDLTSGTLKADAWLDVEYLDTMVYGFFDSPEYKLTEDDGTITVPAGAAGAGERVISAVPAGKSYCSWLLGNNDKAQAYAVGGNYTAGKFVGVKRWAPCSYKVKTVEGGSGSIYKTKQDFKTPKTPAWASAITGVPEDTIKRLAELFAKGGPILSRWSGGQQKQAEGIANLYALQALHIVTKNVGTLGAGFFWNSFTGAQLKKDAGLDLAYTAGVVRGGMPKKPIASCTAWHTAIKMAFAQELENGGYKATYIPNFKTGTPAESKAYWDDGGTKAMLCWERANGTDIDVDGGYYKWKKNADGSPKIAGVRLMYNPGGNIFMNQHENSNDSREMLECLPLNDYTEPHSLCLVSIDNFMSPTPRWSDYVLPASTFWEQQDVMTPTGHNGFYAQQVIPPPGEAKPLWDIGGELLRAYEEIGAAAGIVSQYFNEGETVESVIKKRFANAPADSPYKDMTWKEYLAKPFLSSKPDDYTVAIPARKKLMDNYKLATKTDPFVMKPAADPVNFVPTNEIVSGGYGNEFVDITAAPKSPLRMQVFSPVLTWQYEHKFEKYHGYLPAAQRGQQHKDLEGDPFVLEIPIYYAYQDYFMEAYGGADKLNGLNFLLTTTHNRFRSHSSMAENPLLRELTHRVPGQDTKGSIKPANDYGYYSMPSSRPSAVNGEGVIPTLNMTIKADGTVDASNKEIASYSELWMNEADGTGMGLKDGDLIQVENPIGAVRCVARLSKRCSRGFVGLHQGCWYDPREIGGKTVDVGGNCNTLMASQPSRIDHGNGQQSAMVKITKVNV